MSMQTVNASSALTEEADEARLDGLHQRATPGVGRAHSVFLRKTCTFSSYYHISHQRGGVCVNANVILAKITPVSGFTSCLRNALRSVPFVIHQENEANSTGRTFAFTAYEPIILAKGNDP